MAHADTKGLIEQAVTGVQRLVPALEKLKLVIELELRGRGDVQIYRVELPGPRITKDVASDARVRVSIPRADFNALVAADSVKAWRDAFAVGHATATGPSEFLRLIVSVVDKQEERNRLRRAKARS